MAHIIPYYVDYYIIVYIYSLNPDEERLAFSVIWTIDADGDITSEWFGRTIIKSCMKLSYQHAQVRPSIRCIRELATGIFSKISVMNTRIIN